MSKLRKGHLVRHQWDDRRHGRVVSADVNHPDHLGRFLIAWGDDGYVTQIHPVQLVLDDHPLRGRNTVAEHAVDDWMDDL